MKKFSEVNLQNLGHMTAICLLAGTVAACGGSSGGSAGGDGTDTENLFGNNDTTDSDGDLITDVIEAQLGTDPDLIDSDFDGISDADEDTDNDGVSNIDEINGGTDPAVADSIVIDNGDGDGDGGDNTGGGSDCDRNSDTPEWGDNCTVRNGGSFATSSYTRGIQRILWCQGFDADQDINQFADGIFGDNTEQAVRDFQEANGIAVDGVVGMETWPVLFNALSLISNDTDRDVHSIDGLNCNVEAQFYQLVDGIVLSGWQMAQFPGSTVGVDFGVGAP